MLSPPPPPPEQGDLAAEGPQDKRPWSRPRLKVIEVLFTQSGFDPDPTAIEGALPPAGGTNTYPTGVRYRTS